MRYKPWQVGVTQEFKHLESLQRELLAILCETQSKKVLAETNLMDDMLLK